MVRYKFLGAALLLSLAAGADAAAQEAKFSWAAGAELHYQRYEEPSVGVEMEGPFLGGTLEGRLDANLWMLRADGRVAYGVMDYSSRDTGSDEGIANYVFEGRIVGGRTLPFSADASVTPYAGYGYRTLYDDGGGRRTTTGHAGYDRWSQYHYIPIGIDGDFRLSPSWSMKPNFEYDYFITGTQTSYLSDVRGFSDVENDQDSGYGLRASLMFATNWGQRPIEFGPFVRYWNIDQSDLQPLYFNGGLVALAFEPENETIEAGLAFKLRF
jgi:hypothetical protein